MTSVVVLWQAMSGYFNACLKALAATGDVSVAVAYKAASNEAPFEESQFAWLSPSYRWQKAPQAALVRKLLSEARPDVVLVSSWHIAGYRAVLREIGRPVPRILCMDNQWRGTAKQWLGRLTWRQFIRPYYDGVFVPGDRQAYFARRLGFRTEHVMRGLNCADTSAFLLPASRSGERQNSFLFAGRLMKEKGIKVLAEAYALYRELVAEPWPLLVAGTGPELGTLRGIRGVRLLGFLQPSDLPRAMWSATAVLCPSLFEPWGVVIHEAASAGLIIICSEAVGAGVHLVQDGYNGFVVPTGNATDLAKSMRAVTNMSNGQRHAMSAASVSLSGQFSPDRWAAYVIEMAKWNG
jgi:glycosyltransferase involved in cell wall biosynthesis